MNNTRKAREVVAEARDLLGGNGILLDFHVMRHMTACKPCTRAPDQPDPQRRRDITGAGAFAWPCCRACALAAAGVSAMLERGEGALEDAG